MTEEQKIWFNKIAKDREESAKTLEKPSMSGIKKQVVEKYTDQAQFIYELLQNANDAKATKASFLLKSDGLYFKHNGQIHFSVSNPDTEDQDKENNNLGHINAITSIANSNKTESSIGKFGVGFKAVFQYTDTPHIYDPKIQFKIKRFIIPVEINQDLQYRQGNDTVFYFPFDKKDMLAERAYTEILEKLKKLVYPTLFLSNLNEVKWKAEMDSGAYTQNLIKLFEEYDIKYEIIQLNQIINSEPNIEVVILFTRFNEYYKLSYSIGFFINESQKLIPKKLPAFCFFPTKEITNLNFIIHAPFLLNDSREGIKSYEDHNKKMVGLLSKLAGDSLLILKDMKKIDDDIFEIIPYKEIKGMFEPFYYSIFFKLQSEELLPAKGGTYSKKENAYWADVPELVNLFSNEQLTELVGNKDAKWVFASFGRSKDKAITDYIDSGNERIWDKREANLIKACLDFENKIADMITSDFIKNQPNEWIIKFYEYLSERKSYQEKFKTKPIFKDKFGNAVAAFEQNGKEFHSILFLPYEEIKTSCKTINPELLKNDKSKEFIEKFGIKKPSLKDEIYNYILPIYDDDGDIDTESHFKLFFEYWKTEGKSEDFLNLIRDKKFILYKSTEEEIVYRGKANEIYYPSDELECYFENKKNTNYLNIYTYHNFITHESDLELLKEFFLKLGVSELPRVITRIGKDKLNDEIIKENKLDFGIKIHKRRSNFSTLITNYDLEGIDEILNCVDLFKSQILWSFLKFYEKYYYAKFQYAISTYETRQIEFHSDFIKKLKLKKWLFTKSNELVMPNEIMIDDLSEIYDMNSILEDLLDFKKTDNLTKIERIAQKFENEEEAELAKKLLEEYKALRNSKIQNRNSFEKNKQIIIPEKKEESNYDENIKDLINLHNEYEHVQVGKNLKIFDNNLDNTNDKEIIEDFTKEIEELKSKLEIKKCRIELTKKINNSIKYSYEWFKAYLEFLTTYAEKQGTKKQRSISFQKIKPYIADNHYYLLSGTSNYIPQEVENAQDIKVAFLFTNAKKEIITVEGVSKKGQELLIYCREPLTINIINDISNIYKIEIRFTPVIDLIDRLYKVFSNQNFIDSWDYIHSSIPPLNFIYGPPGTGKTTAICNRINELLIVNPIAKILVLTPTNKAADVVCKKFQAINPTISVLRLSTPTDPELENCALYRDIVTIQDIKNINIVASTIHRLPYFEIQDMGLLFQLRWDYVIFDESSMIGLHYITFAIMAIIKSNLNTKFLIAGDPKQIPPVIEIDEIEFENFDFQDENIYKMMKLESFNPKEQKVRKIDSIENLETQYRSILEIGQLFNEFAYSNLLQHNRDINKKDARSLPEKLKTLITSNVTFVDIPVNQDNSIYKVNKLLYSSYHIYSAILVSEFIKYFDNINKNELWTIGLITPYKAQAVLLNKLITSYGLSEKLKVISDTVHGFQGDECDIVIFVCNPNNYFYSGNEKALLTKNYIYNVAISRAKDYLLILHPYININNPKINQIKRSYDNNFGDSKILFSKDIEKAIFNVENYIEKNSYISGHDDVNVFGLNEMTYFIKASDTAIDIQLRSV